MKVQRLAVAMLALGASVAALPAWAVNCTSPTGQESSIEWFSADQAHKYCDNTGTWRTFGSGSGGGYADHIISSTDSVYTNGTTHTISFTTNGSVANYLDSSGRFIATGISATTNQTSFTTGYFSGNVGIGTTAPSGKFEVAGGNTKLAGNVGVNIDPGSAKLSIGTGSGGASVKALEVVSEAANAGYMQYYMSSNINPSLILRNSSNDAGATLELREYDETRSLRIGTSFIGGNHVGAKDNLQLIFDANNDANGAFEIAKGSWNGRLGTDGTPLLRITNSGNVGIGTTAPAATLQVSGSLIVSSTVTGANPALYVSGTTGYVGIGTTSPGSALQVVGKAGIGMSAASYPLEVYGDVRIDNSGVLRFRNGNSQYLTLQSAGAGTTIYGASGSGLFTISNQDNNDLRLGTNNAERLRILSTGNVGIGTTSPNAKLDVAGTVSSTGVTVTGDIFFTGVASDISDRRRKRNIRNLPSGYLDLVDKLQPVTFRMVDQSNTEYGFIAQDVEKVLPALVITRGSGDAEVKSVNYMGMLAPVVKAIQELKAENAELRRELQSLKRDKKASVRGHRKAKSRRVAH